MDEQDKAEFDGLDAELVKLRNESQARATFDAFLAEAGPIVLEGLDLAATEAAPFVPGGSAGLLVEKVVVSLAKGAVQRWLAKQAPAPQA